MVNMNFECTNIINFNQRNCYPFGGEHGSREKSELCEEVNLRPFVFCSTTVLIPHRKLKFFYQSLGNKIKIFFLIQQHAGGGWGGGYVVYFLTLVSLKSEFFPVLSIGLHVKVIFQDLGYLKGGYSYPLDKSLLLG